MIERIGVVLEQTVGGNELWRIMTFCGVVLAALVAGRLLRWFLERTSERVVRDGRTAASILMVSLTKPAMFAAFVAGLWIGSSFLNLSDSMRNLLTTVVNVLGTAAIGYAIYCSISVVDHYLTRLAKRSKSRVDDMLVPLIGKSLRVTVIALVALQMIQSLSDRPITSILAGLGVGGLAIALAGQDTIKNFFGSIVILWDKPFEIGDKILVDGIEGDVEDVGFRSTKLRTRDGHLVTVANSEVVSKTIRNIGRRPHIWRAANLTIAYDTPPEKVARAVAILRGLLEDHEGLDPRFPPRVHFTDFKDWSLNIEVWYWYHPADELKYLAFSERLNLEILRRFNAEGIEFAFPTQTSHLAGDARHPLAVRVLTDRP